MPVRVASTLPALEELRGENIDIRPADPATEESGEERPLKLAILNLMPLKEMTERDLLRLLGHSPLMIDVDWIDTATHRCRHTSAEHIEKHYKHFGDIKGNRYDGLVITGAPVEKIDFEGVDYWEELTEIMDWARENVRTTLYVCWAALAGLYHHYGVRKRLLDRKLSGVYEHRVVTRGKRLTNGWDDVIYAPHSRYGEVDRKEIENHKDLTLVAAGDESGVYVVEALGGREIFVTGHSEYAPDTLDFEYHRDLKKGISPDIPRNYYPGDDPEREPEVRWRGHAHLLWTNWLHFYANPKTSVIERGKA
ncbi:MAG: homoserine O-succinyltransferase [Muribaculaceae bacterium]|nr:homoserine O-succinyltransferase [Muribaculaceae bacterium]